jgi:hypothetical protein
MNIENWRDIPGYEGLYQVSNTGDVRSLDRVTHGIDGRHYFRKGMDLKLFMRRGYLTCGLSINRTKRTHQVHQLVAMAFLNHNPNGHTLVVDHINNIPSDNRLENLQLVSHRYNSTKDKKEGKSKHTGVSWVNGRKKWKATIRINGTRSHLGLFTDASEAGLAYQNALAKLQENETVPRISTQR